MKTAAHVTALVERRLRSTWHLHLDSSARTPAEQSGLPQLEARHPVAGSDVGRYEDGEGEAGPGDTAGGAVRWPFRVSLGAPTGRDLVGQLGVLRTEIFALRRWAADSAVALTEVTRRVSGTMQPVPSHATVTDVDVAAALCANGWPQRLHRGRARLSTLRELGFAGDLPRVVRDVDGRDDVDVGLLCTTAGWFRYHGGIAIGLTPRQVPVPGVHAKWLNTSAHLVAELAGLPELGLAPGHPPRIHFTYLDPEHLDGGGRRHDSATVGDATTPVYPPSLVLISENKDTAVGFPPVHGGVAVEGGGAGGRTAAAIDWLRQAPTVVYWGDLDADGFAILDGYRAAGVPARSILMDVATYDRYAEFGTSLDKHGSSIVPGRRRDLAHLTAPERELYLRLTDPDFDGHRRLEQERIPLSHALTSLLEAKLLSPDGGPPGCQWPADDGLSG